MLNVRPANRFGVSLVDVISTDDMERRPNFGAGHQQVTTAIQELAGSMIDGPNQVLPRFMLLAMKLGEGVSSGISILEPNALPPVFRWAFLEGSLADFVGVTTPRNYSPCGITIDANQPTLARNAERYYSWISEANIVIPEALLVPLRRGEELLGTLWIVADDVGHFNGGHVTAITELAAFVSVALQMHQTETRLTQALAEQEAIAEEMGHRVKNVFAILEGMIQYSLKGAASKEALAESLSGRVRALSIAHGLVRRSFREAGAAVQTTALTELLAGILRPHEALPGVHSRFAVVGPPFSLGEHAANSLALVLHELATNAAKYGALAPDGGSVEIEWKLAEGCLVFAWQEVGGPPIAQAPKARGLGMRLVQGMVKTLGGTVDHNWHRSGLRVSIRLPLDRLSH